MALKLQNKKELSNYILNQGALIEKALIFNLEYLVAQLENHAKLNAGYEDQTSNLKGSIGGVVLKNGKPISYSGFNEGGVGGNSDGKLYINTLISNYTQGYTILVVAGMNYAAYVEDIHGLNVLKKSELKMQRELPKLLVKLTQKFK